MICPPALTRSTLSTKPSGFATIACDADIHSFQDIPIHTCKRSISVRYLRCTIHYLARYKVSRKYLSDTFEDFPNMMFDQKWELPSSFSTPQSDDSKFGSEEENDDEDDDFSHPPNTYGK